MVVGTLKEEKAVGEPTFFMISLILLLLLLLPLHMFESTSKIYLPFQSYLLTVINFFEALLQRREMRVGDGCIKMQGRGTDEREEGERR